MITKSIDPKTTPIAMGGLQIPPSLWPTTPWTMEERLQRIEAMGQRINGFIGFIRQVGSLSGSSAEAKEKAVTAFYERLVIAERQLSLIQENLRLE